MSSGQFREGTPRTRWKFHCPYCGADVPAQAKKCWLCGETLGKLEEKAAEAGLPAKRGLDHALIAFTVILTVLLVFGMVQDSPGLMVLFLIVMGPAFAALAITPRGHPGRATRVLMTFLGTLAVVSSLALVAVVCFVVAIFRMCTGGGH